jgi:hypothetical protein
MQCKVLSIESQWAIEPYGKVKNRGSHPLTGKSRFLWLPKWVGGKSRVGSPCPEQQVQQAGTRDRDRLSRLLETMGAGALRKDAATATLEVRFLKGNSGLFLKLLGHTMLTVCRCRGGREVGGCRGHFRRRVWVRLSRGSALRFREEDGHRIVRLGRLGR